MIARNSKAPLGAGFYLAGQVNSSSGSAPQLFKYPQLCDMGPSNSAQVRLLSLLL